MNGEEINVKNEEKERIGIEILSLPLTMRSTVSLDREGDILIVSLDRIVGFWVIVCVQFDRTLVRFNLMEDIFQL